MSAGGDRKYHLVLDNAGQLVPGNRVEIGGAAIGSVKSVELTSDSNAEVTFTSDRPLREGTTAIVRATSLSGLANRYIALQPAPDNRPELPAGSTLEADSTTSPVDLDQLFNTFDAPTRKALQDVFVGSATLYAGNGKQANAAYKYLAPTLSTGQQLFQEVSRDQRVLSSFLVQSSQVVTALAERSPQLTSAVSNSNQALGAIAAQNNSFDRALVALPPALRQANTTFVNLRAALNDLDPFVATATASTTRLAPFLKKVRKLAKGSVPVFTDLGVAVHKKGNSNDLADAVADLVALQQRAQGASPHAVSALNSSLPVVQFARPYVPDLVGAISKIGQVTAFYDADGHYARISAAGLGLFSYNSGTGDLEPIPTMDQFTGLDYDIFTRCPGAATQANSGWPVPEDHPFLDNGNLTAADCDPNDVPPGP